MHVSQIQNFGDWELMSMIATDSPVVHSLRDTPKCRAEAIQPDLEAQDAPDTNKCGLDAEELSHEISTKQADSRLSLRQGHAAPSLLSCGKVCGVCATGNTSAQRQNTASGRYGESLLHWGEVDLRRRMEIARGSSCDEKLPRQMIDANSIKITRNTVGRLLNMWFENASIKLNLRIQVFLNRTVRANSSNATWASIVVSGWFFLT
ncbi:hypothetical protein B0H13DRAFT_1935353 [Mycena leptocephala]|nr:hypothetical protein B0H13DRAFT_1935353 [Mycena leptocephala]